MSKTATPWRHEAGSKTIRSVRENYWLATMDSWDGAVNNEANAGFIVKAVNAHEDLVNALTLALPFVETALEDKGYKPGVVDRMTKTIRDALALAEGKELRHV